jgi:hypothetical protein
MDIPMQHVTYLKQELDWFVRVLDARLQSYFNEKKRSFDFMSLPPPPFNGTAEGYGFFVQKHRLEPAERLVLILSLIPHVKPNLLDVFFTKNTRFDRGFSEFGGLKGNSYSGFLPTGETAMFLLASDDLEKRAQYSGLFHPDHFFSRESVIMFSQHSPGEPQLSSQLELNQDFVEFFTTGAPQRPSFSSQFPARLLDTPHEWDDLILPADTLEPVLEVISWIRNGSMLHHRWGTNRHLKKGYRALFYGPPGTGKTLTANLLGKATGIDVYRIDLSLVISKFIGETEKNLSKIFDRAENKNWILFFDEADALFGKRTDISDAHDRYANQEISYLLQRVEDYAGTVLLATNLRSNLDDAFIRRFQSVIHFPMPGKEERYRLWSSALPPGARLGDDVDLERIAEEFELSGASIVNTIQYCLIMSLESRDEIIDRNLMVRGIRKELQKEGKTL